MVPKAPLPDKWTELDRPGVSAVEYCENPEESIPRAVSLRLELSGMSIDDDPNPAPVEMLVADATAETSELPAEVVAATTLLLLSVPADMNERFVEPEVMLLLLSVIGDVNERFVAEVLLGRILELVKSVIELSLTALLPIL